MIEWNTVKYIDCMDKDEGLPSLPDKSIDLCLTDPPYNLNFKSGMTTYNNKLKNRSINYKDKMTPIEYKSWCFRWFEELKRICKAIIFTPGYSNKNMWFKKEDFELAIWYNNYKQGECKIAHFNKFEPILILGKFSKNYENLKKFSKNVFHYNYGFNMEFDYLDLCHPCPKPIKLYRWILESVKPKNVIDPFIGSGTTAEVCTKLGIPWVGYEINEV